MAKSKKLKDRKQQISISLSLINIGWLDKSTDNRSEFIDDLLNKERG